MFHIIPPGTNINFVGRRNLWLGMSALLVVGTLFLFFTKGLNLGIDFTGGAEIHVKVPGDWDIGKLRTELSGGGVQGVKVQQIGEPSAHEFLIRAKADEKTLSKVSEQVDLTLATKLQGGQYEILRSDVVGPAAGSLLRKKGFLAMFYALLVILIYVALRFDSRYAPGAVMALFHDSMVVLGVFVFTQKQFDLTILAALLALVGYSNNDTIIVYDRVRETMHLRPDLTVPQAVNRALNETLGRTIVTSLTTFFVVSSLWFFGGAVIKNFAFTLMVGVVVGTYSSVFIASSLIIAIAQYQKNRETKIKSSGKKRREFKVRAAPKLQG